jgi:hypothetical protein
MASPLKLVARPEQLFGWWFDRFWRVLIDQLLMLNV